MLSYQHIYHAGNFADVQKHAILAAVMKGLRTKPAPMAVFDTHAGRGIYELTSNEAEKNREFDNGISHFWPPQPGPLAPYLDIVRKLNPADAEVTRYPGSSFVAQQLLRPQDRLVSVERHPGEYEKLKQVFGNSPKVNIVKDDGLAALLSALPFREGRGLVIMDPSYELKTDYADVPVTIEKARKKWQKGTFLIWYPIMSAGGYRQMLKDFKAQGITDMLISEIRMDKPPEAHYRMYGSGIAVINPPWPASIMRDITNHITKNMPVKTFGDTFWLHEGAI